MNAILLCGHVIVDAVLGWSLLSFLRHERHWAETLLVSVLLGMYVETLAVGTLIFLGVSLLAAALATATMTGGLILLAFYLGHLHSVRLSVGKPKWYEWAVIASIAEKIVFAAWQLSYTPTFFEDALAHWSGRARSLFGEVNWSFDPTSPVFLGGGIGNRNYPFLTVIWRAVSAKLNGEWNEVLSRLDGVIFFMVIVGTVWLAVWRFSNLRWLSAAAAFAVGAVPLHAWHAGAGYSDIAVEAFVVAALAALLREEWLVGGIMAAGAVWSKNEGLLLYFPSLLIAVGLLQWHRETGVPKWRNILAFSLGFATIAPWLIFNFFHSLGLTLGQSELAWHSDAPGLLWNALIESPTSGILWVAILGCLIYSGLAMLRDRTGRALILAFTACLIAILFLFSSTNAYDFLVNETTIHRTMMQFSAMAILVANYGLWLKMSVNDRPGARRQFSKAKARR